MKRYPLRVAISTLVSGLILASAVSIVGLLYFGIKRALVQTSYEMMGQIIYALGDKLNQRLVRVERLNALIGKLLDSGTLDLRHSEEFVDFLRDTASTNPSIRLIDCGLPSGDKYQALRMADGSVSLRLVRRTGRAVVSTWRHQNPTYAAEYPDTVESLATGYDPRQRPWYQAAQQAGKRVWTDLYSSKDGLNYSNANPVYDGKGNLRCVVAIDMRLEDLSQFLLRLKMYNTGKPFVLDQEGHVLAMPLAEGAGIDALVKRTTRNGWNEYALRPPEEIADPVVRHAVLRYRQQPPAAEGGYLAFHTPDGQRLLASFKPLPKYKFILGVVVPEAEILGPIKRDLNLTLALAGAFFLLSLALAYRIAHAIAKPLATLAGEVDRIRRLDLADVPPVPTRISEVAQIDTSVQNMRKGLRSFKKYVPADVVTRLLSLQKEAVIEGERRELTVFFSDIADFTSISEQLSPEQLVARLGEYFREVTGILIQGEGTVDKFIGDAVMAFWGAPTPLPGHALAACRAALSAQEAIAGLNRRSTAQGGRPFHTRMGIHTGEAIVGNVGFEGRMNYTAMGDSVNLASRLEGLNKYYGTRILVSEATLQAAGAAVLARTVDLVTVKGKERAISIHELLALRADAPAELVDQAERHERAFEHYRNQRWDEALALLATAPPEADGPARVLAERCRHYLGDPPGPDWDGVFRFHEK
jgi:adenylate cyclase